MYYSRLLLEHECLHLDCAIEEVHRLDLVSQSFSMVFKDSFVPDKFCSLPERKGIRRRAALKVL